MGSSEVEVRLATVDDTDEILDVCGTALGWSDPEFDRSLFRWKHFDNTFGRSIILVAQGDAGLVAVRPFMQWAFHDGTTRVTAARAVDTATHPSAQGRGLFTTLTRAGLEHLEAAGVGFVFNTPNAKSLAGYLKMGWVESGHIEFGFAPRALGRLPRIARSRTAAAKTSVPTPELGVDVENGLRALSSTPPPSVDQPRRGQLRTAHTIETLRWRFAQGPITYRWLPVDEDTSCIVRLRQRGPSRELVIAHIVGDPTRRDLGTSIRRAMREVGADYCLTPANVRSTITSSRFGPTLALRPVTQNPARDDFVWEPGDIELF